MRRHRPSRRAAAAVLAATVLVALASGLLGAARQSETLGPDDAAKMRRAVDRYWSSNQHVWPAANREGNPKRLPKAVRESMRDARLRVAREVTTGRLAEWEESFDPAGFLEATRASGSVITDSGYEILSMSEPVLVSPGVATCEMRVRSWGEEYLVDEDGHSLHSSRAENVWDYRYTFRRIEGVWRIERETLLRCPV